MFNLYCQHCLQAATKTVAEYMFNGTSLCALHAEDPRDEGDRKIFQVGALPPLQSEPAVWMPPQQSDPDLLDVEQAAAITSTTVRMMRRLIAEDALPVVKIGRYVRIRRVDLDAYIDAHTRRPPR